MTAIVAESCVLEGNFVVGGQRAQVMPQKYIAPSLENSFNCPHCGALSHQIWLKSYVRNYEKDGIPLYYDNFKPNIENNIDILTDIDSEDKEKRKNYVRLLKSK